MSEEQVTEIQPMTEKTHPVGMGVQRLYRFDNGFGASVVQFSMPTPSGLFAGSYGANAGLWELGVIRWTGDEFHLTYETPITDDVIGHLDLDEVQEILRRIRDLPAVKS